MFYNYVTDPQTKQTDMSCNSKVCLQTLWISVITN